MILGYSNHQIFWLNNSYFSFDPLNVISKHYLFTHAPWYYSTKKSTIRLITSSEYEELVKIQKAISSKKYYELSDIKSKIVKPEFGDTIYFDPNCTIPRIKCNEHWKRTIKLINATTVIVPTPAYGLEFFKNLIIFEDKEQQKLYLLPNLTFVDLPALGQTFESWHNSVSTISPNSRNLKENIEYFENIKHITCCYVGKAICYEPKHEAIFKIFDGIYPFIFPETELLPLIKEEDQAFTMETVTGLIDLLLSPDKASVHQGLRILASMDYAHFPSITKYILKETSRSWSQHKPFNSSVKFMFDSIYKLQEPFTNVLPEEFELAKEIYKKQVHNSITRYISNIQSETNMKLDISFNIDIHLNEEDEINN